MNFREKSLSTEKKQKRGKPEAAGAELQQEGERNKRDRKWLARTKEDRRKWGPRGLVLSAWPQTNEIF